MANASINRLYVRQLIADMLIKWLQWQLQKGASKRMFEESVAACAAYIEGPSKSPVWREALKITKRWRKRGKVPYHMMHALMRAYDVSLR